MVEYSFFQLMTVCSSIMEICETQHFSDAEIERLRVRLSDPKPNGEISFDLGLPRWRVPMS